MKQLAIAAALGMASLSASAGTLLAFGQDGVNRTIDATVVTSDCTTIIGPLCRTEVTATDVAITVSALNAALPTPLGAFLNLDITASSPLLVAGPALFQEYEGHFSITSGAGGAGINYLSADFVDLVAGLSGASALTLSASNPPDPVSFSSDVIDLSNFGLPFALTFSFSDVFPAVASCGNIIHTLCPFASNVSGNMSAEAVPEPGSLALTGLGLFGLAGFLRRRPLAA